MLVGCRDTTILIDCGFSLRETERRLARLAIRPEALTAVILTHEHSDHASGAETLARRHGLPLWCTAGTRQALGYAGPINAQLRPFCADRPFAIGDLEIRPYAVPHDAREPCQLVFSNGAQCLGLLTDAGHITPGMTASLRGCDALILECNHDRDMLADSDYPASLKARIGGPHGHLDNDAAAALLAGLDTGRLQHLVAAHLSEKNNTPWLARSTLEAALGGASERVAVASQDGGLPWRELV
jgi:phosphoribosyl 1,2-cyclic phosphodiesterase